MTQTIYKTIDILSSSDHSQNSTVGTIIDQFKISDDLAKKFQETHPIRNGMSMMPVCYKTYPRVIFMIDYTLDEAILLYRKLFYSTFDIKPSKCDTNKLLNRIDQSNSKFLDVIVDYGGAFESEHLHLIRCAFPHAIIYSIDILYEDLDLLICKLNNDESKWCIIPVFTCTNESDRFQLIESLRQEIEKSLSFWHGLHIWKLEFDRTIDHLQVYDPYTEVLDLGKIHFIDTIDKCEIKPCSLFMAYSTYSVTPNVDSLVSNGLINRDHTIIDMDYATRNSLSFFQRKNLPDNDPRWDDARTQLAQLRSIVGEKTKLAFSLPKTSELRWLNNDMIAQLLNGKFERIYTGKQEDPMVDHYGLTVDFYSCIFNQRSIRRDSIDCINLNSFLIRNNLTNLTSFIVQQCIEQYLGHPWKSEIINKNLSENYPKNLIKECLYEVLGTINHLHIHIDSDDTMRYSFEFIQQLKLENPTIEIEMSFDDKLTDKLTEEIYQSVIILTIECNQNYVLVYVEINCFLQYISTCQSLEEIQTKIESSVRFSFSLGHGQTIKWHRNLSFIYLVAYYDESLEKIRENILSKGLKDLIFVTKKLLFLFDDWKQPQYRKNQAVLCFDFSTDVYDYRRIPENYNQLDQWIWDEHHGIYTGPFITVYPNISKYPGSTSTYPSLNLDTNVMGIYNLLCNNVLIQFKWRSFFMCDNHFQ